jgi:Tetracyclin repressor-like, C-terminal domain
MTRISPNGDARHRRDGAQPRQGTWEPVLDRVGERDQAAQHEDEAEDDGEMARSLLYPPAADAANGSDRDVVGAAVAAWSLMHGLATLWLNKNLPPPARRRPRTDRPRGR